jgi:hypothetical protein
MRRGAGSQGEADGRRRFSSRSPIGTMTNGALTTWGATSTTLKTGAGIAACRSAGNGSSNSPSGGGLTTTCFSGFQLDLFSPSPTSRGGGRSGGPESSAPVSRSAIWSSMRRRATPKPEAFRKAHAFSGLVVVRCESGSSHIDAACRCGWTKSYRAAVAESESRMSVGFALDLEKFSHRPLLSRGGGMSGEFRS